MNNSTFTIQNGSVVITQTIPTSEYVVTVQNTIDQLQTTIINQQSVLKSLNDQITTITGNIADFETQLATQQDFLTQLQ